MKRQKQKSINEKQYQTLKSIHEEVEQQLYCLKKEQEILIKLLQREENKFKKLSKQININYEENNQIQNYFYHETFKIKDSKLNNNSIEQKNIVLENNSHGFQEGSESQSVKKHKNNSQKQDNYRMRMDEQLYFQDQEQGFDEPTFNIKINSED